MKLSMMTLVLGTVAAVAGSSLAGPMALQGVDPMDRFEVSEPSALAIAQMQKKAQDQQPPMALAALSAVPCIGGDAAGYPCSNVDLLSFLPLADIGGGNGNDIWGWTDPLTDREYAIMGRTSGTSFVDVTDPVSPVYLGDLPTQTVTSTWRDVKVYDDHAFIVSEANGHGMQVFDLTQLRSVTAPPVTFAATVHYAGFGSAHNVAINEATGFAYAIGTRTCFGGAHIVDIREPLNPIFAGCNAGDRYTHDSQCVVYSGPDAAYCGREICFDFNEDTLTISDVTDKNGILRLSRTGYPGRAYTHQGWVTEDHAYLLMDDEGDETGGGGRQPTRTLMWDITSLAAPVYLGDHLASSPAIDHNLYIRGNVAFETNYRAGLRILDISEVAAARLSEVGYFDVYPADDATNFNGAWSNYPFFKSGIVIVSGIEQGLFVLDPHLPVGLLEPRVGLRLPSVGNDLRAVRVDGDVALELRIAPPAGGGFTIYRSVDPQAVGDLLAPPITTMTSSYVDVTTDAVTPLYAYRARNIDSCLSEGP